MATAKSPLWMIDTNILIYAHNANDPRHAKAKALRDDALRGVVAACVTPQVLYEFYANVTGSKVPQPLAPVQAAREVENYFRTRRIAKIYPKRRTLLKVLHLTKTYNLTKQAIFDATLLAIMLDNGVSRIYTENIADFTRFSSEGLMVVNPLSNASPICRTGRACEGLTIAIKRLVGVRHHLFDITSLTSPLYVHRR